MDMPALFPCLIYFQDHQIRLPSWLFHQVHLSDVDAWGVPHIFLLPLRLLWAAAIVHPHLNHLQSHLEYDWLPDAVVAVVVVVAAAAAAVVVAAAVAVAVVHAAAALFGSASAGAVLLVADAGAVVAAVVAVVAVAVAVAAVAVAVPELSAVVSKHHITQTCHNSFKKSRICCSIEGRCGRQTIAKPLLIIVRVPRWQISVFTSI